MQWQKRGLRDSSTELAGKDPIGRLLEWCDRDGNGQIDVEVTAFSAGSSKTIRNRKHRKLFH